MTTDILFLHTSYLITLIALAIREILWLRIVLTVAQFGHLSHSYLNLDSNTGTWIIVFIVINIENHTKMNVHSRSQKMNQNTLKVL